jgi:hypothetical protein
VSTERVFSNLDASIWVGTVRALPSFARQSEMKRIRTIKVRSAGPLISKFRKRELARKRSSVSSTISACEGSAAENWVNATSAAKKRVNIHQLGLVREFSSLSAERPYYRPGGHPVLR